MNGNVPAILTIGYEGITDRELLLQLSHARVEHVLDVRWRPQSRKRGLSKTPLSRALHEVGMSYTHERGLGTPPDILKAAHDNGVYDWDRYEEFLLQQSDALRSGRIVAEHERTALLCFEASPQECHRRVVARQLAATLGFRVEHL